MATTTHAPIPAHLVSATAPAAYLLAPPAALPWYDRAGEALAALVIVVGGIAAAGLATLF